MRPRGEIREALGEAARRLVPPGSVPGHGVTWRELVRAACVGELMGRRTVVDMQRAGELVVVGQRAVPGICRPVNLYAPAQPAPRPGVDLAQALRSWAPGAPTASGAR